MKKSILTFLIYFIASVTIAYAQKANISATYHILLPINNNVLLHWSGGPGEYSISRMQYALRPLPMLEGLISKMPGIEGVHLYCTSAVILDEQLKAAASNNNGNLWGKLLVSRDALSGFYKLTLQFDAFPGKFYKGSLQNLNSNAPIPQPTPPPGTCDNSWCLPGGFPQPTPPDNGCTSDWCGTGQVN